MSDKPTATNGGYFAIPETSLISLRGEDATRFAQAQFMGDVAALAPGHWQWNGWLTPKGRVIALFALYKRSDADLGLLLLDAEPAGFVAALSRFVFRSKVRIAHEADLHAQGRFSAPLQAAGARFAEAEAGVESAGLEFDLGAEGRARSLRIAALPAPADALAAADWRSFDLAHGLPRLPPGQAQQWTPQQLSLDRLGAYSVRKGCYPGQEIVARTHFLGQAKRALVRLAAQVPLAAGDVRAPSAPQPLGQVVCVAGLEALAVLPLEAGDGPFSVTGIDCRVLPLQDGLAR